MRSTSGAIRNKSARPVLLLIGIAAALFVADVAATQALFTSRHPGANDFFSRWEGARAYWQDGLNPYSDEVTLRIQVGIYGRPAQGDEDPGPFAYPFYTALTLLPLVSLPYSWVEAIWIALLEFCLGAIALMSVWLLRWRLRPIAVAGLILFALFNYNSARAILLGQYAVLIAALVIGSLLAIRARRDAAAGVLLALATMKPQMVFLIIPYILLWSIARRRWRIPLSFVVAMAVLAGLSFALLPSWLGDFLAQLRNYTAYTAIGSPVWVVAQYYLQWGDAGEWIVSGLLALALIGVWAWQWRAADWGTFQWLCGLTLIVSNLIAVRTATTNYVILYPALLLVAKSIVDRAPRRGGSLVALGAAVVLVGTWLLFSATVVNKFEHPLMYLPLPFGLAAVFALWRRALIDTAERGA